jgi:hypothetical protein
LAEEEQETREGSRLQRPTCRGSVDRWTLSQKKELAMPDLSAIAGALASLNAAVNITTAMKDLRDWSLVQSKVIELQGAILDAQSSLFSANEERLTLIKKVSDLEAAVTKLKEWDSEKKKYTLTEAGPGVFAYIKKSKTCGTEPPHYLCAKCYEDSKKSILHRMDTASMGNLLTCPTCNARMLIRHGYKPPDKASAGT